MILDQMKAGKLEIIIETLNEIFSKSLRAKGLCFIIILFQMRCVFTNDG
jgi:hypothetical protein